MALLFSIRPQKPSEPGRKPVCMEELFNILSEGKAHVRVEMDAADLKAFSDELIRRAKDELGSMVEAARKERMLSKTEVKELFGVCDATLWPPLRQAVAPLLKLDEDSDRIYAQEIRQYRKWEKLTAKQHKQQSLPEEMEMPQRKCHVVVNSTIEALVSALRDNPRGVLIYNDEIDSLLSNFNRYSGSDESYFLSLFSGTPFKYTRKSNNEYIFLPNPYCSIIGFTQPGMLSSLFGGKRSQNGFSSRFLKVYPDIAAMSSWNEASMPEEVLDEWERIIRQADAVQPPAGQEGRQIPLNFSFRRQPNSV